MVDLVDATCSECSGTFKVWLARGEIAPALCLGCWWNKPDNACLGPGPVRTAAEQNRDYPECKDADVGDAMLPGTGTLSPKKRGKAR
jgi:hypothetical protein